MKLPRQADPRRLQILEVIILNMRADFINALEIGSYAGESAIHIANCINKYTKQGGTLLCLDTWKPYFSENDRVKSEHYKLMEQSLANGEAYTTFVQKTTAFNDLHLRTKIFWEKITSKDLPKGAVYDLIYIDGSHYYRDIKQDIQKAKQICKSGGIICGDDLEKQMYEVTPAACYAASETIDRDGSYHPGVTRAVWESFGYVWANSGLWVVKKQ